LENEVKKNKVTMTDSGLGIYCPKDAKKRAGF